MVSCLCNQPPAVRHSNFLLICTSRHRALHAPKATVMIADQMYSHSAALHHRGEDMVVAITPVPPCLLSAK